MKHFINYIIFLFFGIDDYFENNENNENNKNILQITNDNNSHYKKIILLLLFLLIGISFYYLYFIPPDNTLENNLKIIKKTVDEKTFLQIEAVIYEMMTNPEKKKAGFLLLNLFKMITKPERILNEKKFHEYLDRIIEILTGKD